MANQTLYELVADFLESKQADPGISTATYGQYEFVLRSVLLPWASHERLTDPDRLDQKAVNRYAAHLKTKTTRRGKPLSKASIATYIRGVNAFIRWAARQGEMAAVAAPGAAMPSGKNRPKIDVLTADEMDSLEAAAKTPRDRIIVRILSDSGVRLGELLGLRVGDVLQENSRHYLRVTKSKTDPRRIGISRDLYKRIQSYISGGRPGKADDGDPLFISLRRRPNGDYEPLTASGVQQMIRNAGHEAGIKKRVHPHLLRHSMATSYLNVTGDPVTLADQLGHSSLAMIQQTYAHLADDQRHSAMLDYLQKRKEKQAADKRLRG